MNSGKEGRYERERSIRARSLTGIYYLIGDVCRDNYFLENCRWEQVAAKNQMDL